MIIVFPFVFDILYTEKVAEINWIDKNVHKYRSTWNHHKLSRNILQK